MLPWPFPCDLGGLERHCLGCTDSFHVFTVDTLAPLSGRKRRPECVFRNRGKDVIYCGIGRNVPLVYAGRGRQGRL